MKLLEAALKAAVLITLLPMPVQAGAPEYAWLADWPAAPAETVALADRFPTPEGFTRVTVAPDGLGAWLRRLPLYPDRTEVRAYDGGLLSRPAVAVVALDVGKRDVQQCADSILRLHAEYLWHRGLARQAAYHFTSGDRSAFDDWARGERFAVQGARVKRVAGKASGHGHEAFRAWLMHTFLYAGTQSLRLDSDPVGERPLEAGDFFVQPGGPGHAVVLLDVAEDAAGHRIGLIGQGFMPAEDLHVLAARGPHDQAGVWFALPTAEAPWVATPSWAPFHLKQARRFRTPSAR